MNDQLFMNNHGLRLITQFEGAPRLKARLCEGGRYELSYGVTFDLDGSPFTAESSCTEEYAMALFRNALQKFEDIVRRLVTVELNANQFSALVAICYNIGEDNFSRSTLLREVNAGRFFDAAAAFGMWVFATKEGYKQALRGLLRRQYASACLFLSYDWEIACADEAIALQREKPASIPGTDKVRYKTPFKEVLAVAQQYPLQLPIPEIEQDLVLDTPAAEEASTKAKGTEPVQSTQPTVQAPSPDPRVNETAKSEHDAPVVSKIPPIVDTTVSDPVRASRDAALPPKDATELPSGPEGSKAPPVTPSVSDPAPSPLGPAAGVKPAPAEPPLVIAGQDGAKPVHPQTRMPDGIGYGIDQSAGAKPLESTERFVGAAMMWVANGLRVGMANGLKLSGPLGFIAVLFLDMMKQPVTAALICTTIVAIVLGVGWFFGFVLDKAGLKKKKKGEAGASQLMY